MRAVSILTGLALATAVIAPTSASAQSTGAHEYAEAQCGNGRYAALGYVSYEECYEAAVYYYQWQVENGGGGGGGGGGDTGGGGGGTWIPDLPGKVVRGCASRLPCYPIAPEVEPEP